MPTPLIHWTTKEVKTKRLPNPDMMITITKLLDHTRASTECQVSSKESVSMTDKCYSSVVADLLGGEAIKEHVKGSEDKSYDSGIDSANFDESSGDYVTHTSTNYAKYLIFRESVSTQTSEVPSRM